MDSSTSYRDAEKQADPFADQSPERGLQGYPSKEEPLAPTQTGAFSGADGGKNYRVLGRWKTALIFINNEVGIGILSLPAALDSLGLIPGLIGTLAADWWYIPANN